MLDTAQLDQMPFVKLPATAFSEQREQVEEMMAMVGVMEANCSGGEDRYLKDGDKMVCRYHFALVGIWY